MQSELMRSGAPSSISTLLEQVVGRRLDAGIEKNERAAAAWRMSNGEVERRHTHWVWLRDSGRRGVAPVMVIEVDSHSLITDFNAKRDVYLGRLAFYGQQVSKIEFRYAPHARAGADLASASGATECLPQLTAAERERLDALALKAPESLRPVVRRALEASFRRTKADARVG